METLFVTLPILLFAIAMAVGAMACSRRFLHLLQLDSYQLDGYRKSVRRSAKTDGCPLVWQSLSAALLAGAAAFLEGAARGLGTAAAALTAVILLFVATGYGKRQAAIKAKKEFVKTQRMERLIRTHTLALWAAGAVLSAVAIMTLLIAAPGAAAPLRALLYSACVLLVLMPLWLLPYAVALAAQIRQPAENRINRGFIEDAMAILRDRPDLIRIGITGSYGKTSTKFILGAILREKYNVLVPPSSYNTPMGVTRMVREMLHSEHEVMICEMGARRVGEIRELCDIVHPLYGILTSIGPQHLETFHSIENIKRTKYELMESLPPGGMGFFAADGALCEALYASHKGEKGLFGIDEGEEKDLYLSARNVRVGAFGSEFDLVTRDGESIHCQTGLLGRHNISNILGCAACAYALGMTLEEIAAGIAKAEPVEHRLQLMNPGNGTLVIDDAFNSNPSGARAAMDVLSMFDGFRKICVTPGMVELGPRQEEENYAFGTLMAGVCDIAILVGERQSAPIRRGMEEAGFPKEMLFTAKNLDEATAILGHLIRAGDVILFENDLPDNYNE